MLWMKTLPLDQYRRVEYTLVPAESVAQMRLCTKHTHLVDTFTLYHRWVVKLYDLGLDWRADIYDGERLVMACTRANREGAEHAATNWAARVIVAGER